MVLDAGGNKVAEARHYPYGTERWRGGTFPTDYRFTGQWEEASLGLEPLTSLRFAEAAGRPERFPKPFGSRLVE